ncbi:MAG: hypothetical protein EA392_11870 [Cryomorphaceae bacterium]|nr:MAG: hypothetical protein EA392_11870 [Cryomorphaceae bacterium]
MNFYGTKMSTAASNLVTFFNFQFIFLMNWWVSSTCTHPSNVGVLFHLLSVPYPQYSSIVRSYKYQKQFYNKLIKN